MFFYIQLRNNNTGQKPGYCLGKRRSDHKRDRSGRKREIAVIWSCDCLLYVCLLLITQQTEHCLIPFLLKEINVELIKRNTLHTLTHSLVSLLTFIPSYRLACLNLKVEALRSTCTEFKPELGWTSQARSNLIVVIWWNFLKEILRNTASVWNII